MKIGISSDNLAKSEKGPIKIGALEQEDFILSPNGWGTLSYNQVKEIKKGPSLDEWIMIKTTSHSVFLAPNQGIFARLPDSPKLWFLFLASFKDMGFRLGISTNRGLASAASSGESLWILGIYGASQNARAAQIILSCRWGIPPIPFAGGKESDMVIAQEVFTELDTKMRASLFMKESLLRPNRPHISGNSPAHGGIKTEIRLFAEKASNGPHLHELAISSGNDLGHPGMRGRRVGNSWYLFASRPSIEELVSMTQVFGEKNEMDIRVTGSLMVGINHQLLPAVEIIPGMRVVVAGDLVVEETVESVERRIFLNKPVQFIIDSVHTISVDGILIGDRILSQAIYG